MTCETRLDIVAIFPAGSGGARRGKRVAGDVIAALVLGVLAACGNSHAKTDAGVTLDGAASGGDAEVGLDGWISEDASLDGSEPELDGGPSIMPDGVVGPDGQVGVCCPVGYPSCDCPDVGGWVPTLEQCLGGICDVAPPSWDSSVDEYGCEILVVVGNESCFVADAGDEEDPDPDAGHDAGRDAGHDAGDRPSG